MLGARPVIASGEASSVSKGRIITSRRGGRAARSAIIAQCCHVLREVGSGDDQSYRWVCEALARLAFALARYLVPVAGGAQTLLGMTITVAKSSAVFPVGGVAGREGM